MPQHIERIQLHNQSLANIINKGWFFSKTESIFVLRDKLLPGTKPGFLKSEKMLRFILLYIHKSVSENVYVHNIVFDG